jgi:hypothetical protein
LRSFECDASRSGCSDASAGVAKIVLCTETVLEAVLSFVAQSYIASVSYITSNKRFTCLITNRLSPLHRKTNAIDRPDVAEGHHGKHS